MNSDVLVGSSEMRIPKRYWAWLGGVTLSSVGTQILSFGMAWVAAGYGGIFAGLVLTAVNLPRTVLLLAGGAVSDRIGAWRVMISGDIAMTVVTALFAGSLLAWGPNIWLLMIIAVLIGIVDAFYIPAAGAMPRRLVTGAKLTQAMSARQISQQLSSVLGGPLGSIVVTTFGLFAAAIVNSAAYAVMFILLILIRPRNPAPPASGGVRVTGQTVFQDALAGFGLSVKDPLLRPVLLMLVGSAAFLLPVLAPLLPVLARQEGWSPTGAGLVVGVSGAGTAVVALAVVFTGGLPRPGLAGCAGLATAGLGVFGLGIFSEPLPSMISGAFIGVGAGLFSTHLGPLVLGRTPDTHLGRVQAVVAMAQSLPLLFTNVALGALAQAAGAKVALFLCATALGVIAAVAIRSPHLRAARRLGSE